MPLRVTVFTMAFLAGHVPKAPVACRFPWAPTSFIIMNVGRRLIRKCGWLGFVVVIGLASVPAGAKEAEGWSVGGFLKGIKSKLLPPSCSPKREAPTLVPIDQTNNRTYCCPETDVAFGGNSCGDIYPCEPYDPKNICRGIIAADGAKLKAGCIKIKYTQDWWGLHAAHRKAAGTTAPTAKRNRPCCISIDGVECGKELPLFSHQLCSEYCGSEYGAGYCE
jgi:hypothetical protein